VAARAAPFLPPIGSPFVNSTVATNGDINPLGLVFVPSSFPVGALNGDDIVISNYSNKRGLPGLGTTLTRVTSSHRVVTFFTGPFPGLSPALGLVQAGFVIAGQLPTTDGTCATVGAGSLVVIDYNGNLVGKPLTDAVNIDGPWGLTVNDQDSMAQIFVANALSGSVSRLDVAITPPGKGGGVKVTKAVQIARGYKFSCSSKTFVLGPSGLFYDSAADQLYVASTADNAIFVVNNAGRTTSATGKGSRLPRVSLHEHGVFGLAGAPNGNLLVSDLDLVNPNSGQPSMIVELTASGQFVSQFSIDKTLGSASAIGTCPITPGTNHFCDAGVRPGPTRLAVLDRRTAQISVWREP
jgi:hypothetical protein